MVRVRLRTMIVVALLLISAVAATATLESMTEDSTAIDLNQIDVTRIASSGEFSWFYENVGQIGNEDIMFYGRSGTCLVEFASSAIYSVSRSGLVSQIRFLTKESIAPVGEGIASKSNNFILGERGTFNTARAFNWIVYPNLWDGVSLVFSMSSGAITNVLLLDSSDSLQKIEAYRGDSLKIDIEKVQPASVPDVIMLPHEVTYSCMLDLGSFAGTHKSPFIGGSNMSQKSGTVDWMNETAFGGEKSDYSRIIARDPSGDVFIAGTTWSGNFITETDNRNTQDDNSDCFIIRMNDKQDEIKYCTVFGGNSRDTIASIGIDQEGVVVAVGTTESDDFPLVNPLLDEYRGGLSDGFILRLNSEGDEILFSTYFGDNGDDYIEDMCLDSLGNLYITGFTSSHSFPLRRAFDNSFNGGLFDCFVAMLSRTGSIVFSTFVGGERADHAVDIAVGSQGSIYVTGYTYSQDFPVVNALDFSHNGAADCFIFKFGGYGRYLEFSTFLGGSWVEKPSSMVVDGNDDIYVTGDVYSDDFPLLNSYNSTYGGKSDSFVFKIAGNGKTLCYSTYIGTRDDDHATGIAVDTKGFVYLTGYSDSGKFPIVKGNRSSAKGPTAFVVKLNPTGNNIVFSTELGEYGTESYGESLLITQTGEMCITGQFEQNIVGGPLGSSNFEIFVAKLFDISDSDNDTLLDYLEYQLGLDRYSSDTDNDNLTDDFELLVLGTNPLSNDSDSDNVSDYSEVFFYGTNPLSNDSDSDGLPDGEELFVLGSRPLQNDSDSDSLSDGSEVLFYLTSPMSKDTDQDLLSDFLEISVFGTLPYNSDSDGDSIDDGKEVFLYFTNPLSYDSDGDTLSDSAELFSFGTSPIRDDSDNDSLTDDQELNVYHTSPLLTDTDGDSVPDNEEIRIYHTDPLLPDSDSDGLPDGWEVFYGLNPLSDDSVNDLDMDTLTNLNEFDLGTSPVSNDTDSDLILDQDEVNLYSTNPLSNDSDGDLLDDYSEIFAFGTLPNEPDTDSDTMPDGWETLYGLNPLLNDSKSDLDSDGLLNYLEYSSDCLPNATDSDSDTLSDADEVLIYGTNPSKKDTDGDQIDDNIELGNTNPNDDDSDHDQLNDYQEIYVFFTNPNNNDSDNDLMPDGWEVLYSLDPGFNDSCGDYDSDGITNLFEYMNGTNPLLNDTDHDSLSDYEEIHTLGTDPTMVDTDLDSMPDWWEVYYHLDATHPSALNDTDTDGLEDSEEYSFGSNPRVADTDQDGLLDGLEINILNTSPTSVDSDNDSLQDLEEIIEFFTKPDLMDTDADGMPDGWEVLNGLNPLVDDSRVDNDRDGLWNIEEYEYESNPASSDGDSDSLSDVQEIFSYKTQPSNPDSDSDIMPDGWEIEYGFAPLIPDGNLDEDGEGLTNAEEYVAHSNPLESDSDGDNLSDFEEVVIFHSSPIRSDTDGDAIPDFEEANLYHTDLNSTDSDHDGMPDGWEIVNGLDPISPDGINDNDGDLLSNIQEYQYGIDPNSDDSDSDSLADYEEIFTLHTDPRLNDTDGDALTDDAEIQVYFTDPLNRDTDGDGLRDGYEVKYHLTDPLNPDSDGDTMDDGWELKYGLNPFIDDRQNDMDYDRLTNLEEYLIGSNPANVDSDSDGIGDFTELNTFGTSPTKSDTDGDLIPDNWEVTHGIDPTYYDAQDDPDNDLLSNYEEYIQHSDPMLSDSDNDGISDGDEITIYATNPASNDTDRDGISDSAEIFQHHTHPQTMDSDFDGVDDLTEITLNMNPALNDSDGDALPDKWELDFGTSVLENDAAKDYDGDSLTNIQEFLIGTDPWDSDSDNDSLDDDFEALQAMTSPIQMDSDCDGMADGWEMQFGFDPLFDDSKADFDGDMLSNIQEFFYNTNPKQNDTDGDTLTDAREVFEFRTNPICSDSDADGLSDSQEIQVYGTDPRSDDSDADGLGDELEIDIGTDPLSLDSDTDGISDLWEYMHGFNPLNSEIPLSEFVVYNSLWLSFCLLAVVLIGVILVKKKSIASAARLFRK